MKRITQVWTRLKKLSVSILDDGWFWFSILSKTNMCKKKQDCRFPIHNSIRWSTKGAKYHSTYLEGSSRNQQSAEYGYGSSWIDWGGLTYGAQYQDKGYFSQNLLQFRTQVFTFYKGADSVSAKKVLQALVIQISSPYILISECYTGSKKAESNFIRSQSQNSGLSRDSKHRSARSHSLATATTSKILNKSFQGTII